MPTPLPAQRILNSSSFGTFATGIFFTKDQTRELITGKSQYWYKQKNSSIDHLCLISHGSKIHKQAMNEYEKECNFIQHNFIQQSLNLGSAQAQILLTVCRRFKMVRISDNGPGWN